MFCRPRPITRLLLLVFIIILIVAAAGTQAAWANPPVDELVCDTLQPMLVIQQKSYGSRTLIRINIFPGCHLVHLRYLNLVDSTIQFNGTAGDSARVPSKVAIIIAGVSCVYRTEQSPAASGTRCVEFASSLFNASVTVSNMRVLLQPRSCGGTDHKEHTAHAVYFRRNAAAKFGGGVYILETVAVTLHDISVDGVELCGAHVVQCFAELRGAVRIIAANLLLVNARIDGPNLLPSKNPSGERHTMILIGFDGVFAPECNVSVSLENSEIRNLSFHGLVRKSATAVALYVGSSKVSSQVGLSVRNISIGISRILAVEDAPVSLAQRVAVIYFWQRPAVRQLSVIGTRISISGTNVTNGVDISTILFLLGVVATSSSSSSSSGNNAPLVPWLISRNTIAVHGGFSSSSRKDTTAAVLHLGWTPVSLQACALYVSENSLRVSDAKFDSLDTIGREVYFTIVYRSHNKVDTVADMFLRGNDVSVVGARFANGFRYAVAVYYNAAVLNMGTTVTLWLELTGNSVTCDFVVGTATSITLVICSVFLSFGNIANPKRILIGNNILSNSNIDTLAVPYSPLVNALAAPIMGIAHIFSSITFTSTNGSAGIIISDNSIVNISLSSNSEATLVTGAFYGAVTDMVGTPSANISLSGNTIDSVVIISHGSAGSVACVFFLTHVVGIAYFSAENISISNVLASSQVFVAVLQCQRHSLIGTIHIYSSRISGISTPPGATLLQVSLVGVTTLGDVSLVNFNTKEVIVQGSIIERIRSRAGSFRCVAAMLIGIHSAAILVESVTISDVESFGDLTGIQIMNFDSAAVGSSITGRKLQIADVQMDGANLAVGSMSVAADDAQTFRVDSVQLSDLTVRSIVLRSFEGATVSLMYLIFYSPNCPSWRSINVHRVAVRNISAQSQSQSGGFRLFSIRFPASSSNASATISAVTISDVRAAVGSQLSIFAVTISSPPDDTTPAGNLSEVFKISDITISHCVISDSSEVNMFILQLETEAAAASSALRFWLSDARISQYFTTNLSFLSVLNYRAYSPAGLLHVTNAVIDVAVHDTSAEPCYIDLVAASFLPRSLSIDNCSVLVRGSPVTRVTLLTVLEESWLSNHSGVHRLASITRSRIDSPTCLLEHNCAFLDLQNLTATTSTSFNIQHSVINGGSSGSIVCLPADHLLPFQRSAAVTVTARDNRVQHFSVWSWLLDFPTQNRNGYILGCNGFAPVVIRHASQVAGVVFSDPQCDFTATLSKSVLPTESVSLSGAETASETNAGTESRDESSASASQRETETVSRTRVPTPTRSKSQSPDRSASAATETQQYREPVAAEILALQSAAETAVTMSVAAAAAMLPGEAMLVGRLLDSIAMLEECEKSAADGTQQHQQRHRRRDNGNSVLLREPLPFPKNLFGPGFVVGDAAVPGTHINSALLSYLIAAVVVLLAGLAVGANNRHKLLQSSLTPRSLKKKKRLLSLYDTAPCPEFLFCFVTATAPNWLPLVGISLGAAAAEDPAGSHAFVTVAVVGIALLLFTLYVFQDIGRLVFFRHEMTRAQKKQHDRRNNINNNRSSGTQNKKNLLRPEMNMFLHRARVDWLPFPRPSPLKRDIREYLRSGSGQWLFMGSGGFSWNTQSRRGAKAKKTVLPVYGPVARLGKLIAKSWGPLGVAGYSPPNSSSSSSGSAEAEQIIPGYWRRIICPFYLPTIFVFTIVVSLLRGVALFSAEQCNLYRVVTATLNVVAAIFGVVLRPYLIPAKNVTLVTLELFSVAVSVLLYLATAGALNEGAAADAGSVVLWMLTVVLALSIVYVLTRWVLLRLSGRLRWVEREKVVTIDAITTMVQGAGAGETLLSVTTQSSSRRNDDNDDDDDDDDDDEVGEFEEEEDYENETQQQQQQQPRSHGGGAPAAAAASDPLGDDPEFGEEYGEWPAGEEGEEDEEQMQEAGYYSPRDVDDDGTLLVPSLVGGGDEL